MADFVITKEEEEWGSINYHGDKYSAWEAFCQLNRKRHLWQSYSSEKKVLESHSFYDRVFRCKQPAPVWISTTVNRTAPKTRNGTPKSGEYTKDHPFSSRLATRAILTDHQWLLDDFNLFFAEFLKITKTVGVTSDENEDVKIDSNGDGEVSVSKIITERYEHIQFINVKTLNQSWGLPLDIPDWYLFSEEKRSPARLPI